MIRSNFCETSLNGVWHLRPKSCSFLSSGTGASIIPNVCRSVRGKNFYMKEMYFASHTFQVSLTHKCKIILILANVYFPPFLVSIPSWCVFPICLKSILQSPASCCQSCVLATTEHKYVQLLALLRRMVDCTLYHVIFNSSPNRKLNYHHVCT